MKKKCAQFGIVIIFCFSILFSSCRQGLNDNEIDPVVVTHAKALVDFYSLNCSLILKVYQYETKDCWLYVYRANWNDYFPDEEEPKRPSDLIKYKDKYIIFWIRGKKELDEKLLHEILGISSVEELPRKPQGCIDHRVWYYLKDKHTNRSAFVQSEFGIPIMDIPGLSAFRHYTFHYDDIIR